MWRDWVAPGSIATDMTATFACGQSLSPGLDEEEKNGMFSWPTKLSLASLKGPGRCQKHGTVARQVDGYGRCRAW